MDRLDDDLFRELRADAVTNDAWDEAAFLAWCKDEMANYKAPRSVEVVDALPLNASGKVLKYVLRDGVAG